MSKSCDCQLTATEIIDMLEKGLRQAVAECAINIFDDEVLARKYVLSLITNERDRAIYEILLKQPMSPSSGKRSGRRKSYAAQCKNEWLLTDFKSWQKDRAGSDRQFAAWWHKHETKKEATEADIKRITKRLRDARRRVEHQSS
jgi:hypothetical protein